MTTSSGLTKTQVYYPTTTRPRSFSAGCSTATAGSNVTKRSGTTNSMKVVKLNSSSRFSYPRTKSADENKPSTTARYKTELCRPFQDYGFCRYGDKCQFAHGEDDLRVLPRHPKYKTDLCRTYHTRGFCPYGSRCHFIHNLDEARKASDEVPPSPTKKTLSFSLPISPSLDSGISSPDDIQCFSNGGSGVFDFQGLDNSSGSGSEDSDYVPSYSPETNIASSNLYSPLCGPSYFPDPLESQRDKCVEYDSLSVGSSSPAKRVSDLLDPEPQQDVRKMMEGLKIGNNSALPRTSSGHRLPVFDTISSSNETNGSPYPPGPFF